MQGERCQNLTETATLETRKRTLEFSWRNDLDGHDRLKDDWFGALVRLSERSDRTKTESQLGRIDDVEGTILENETNTADLVATERTLLQCVVEALNAVVSTA